MLLIRDGIAKIILVEDCDIGKVTGLQIAALAELEAVCRRAGHAADRRGQRVAGAPQRVPQELRKAILDRGVLYAVLLYPCVGHIQAMWVMLEFRDDFRRGIRAHVDAPLEIAGLTEHQVRL